MTLQELLKDARSLDRLLRAPVVQASFLAQPEDVRRRFVSHKQELSSMIARLTNAQTEAIAGKLDELSAEIKKGAAEVSSKIDQVDKPAPLLKALASFLGLLARVAVLVR